MSHVHSPETEADEATGEVPEDRQAEHESKDNRQAEGLRCAKGAGDEPGGASRGVRIRFRFP